MLDNGRGRGMLRAAAWTCGLFVLGGGIVQLFPGPFTEPLVLLALGTTLFLVSGHRASVGTRVEADTAEAEDVEPTRAAR